MNFICLQSRALVVVQVFVRIPQTERHSMSTETIPIYHRWSAQIGRLRNCRFVHLRYICRATSDRTWSQYSDQRWSIHIDNITNQWGAYAVQTIMDEGVVARCGGIGEEHEFTSVRLVITSAYSPYFPKASIMS